MKEFHSLHLHCQGLSTSQAGASIADSTVISEDGQVSQLPYLPKVLWKEQILKFKTPGVISASDLIVSQVH